MAFVRAGPEHAVLVRDPLVRDAGVIGCAARTRATQFGEAGFGIDDEAGAAAEPGRDPVQDVGVGPHAFGRCHGLGPANDTPFEVRHRAVLLGPLRGRQHDIGAGRRLRQERVRHDEEFELVDVATQPSGVGARHDDVGREDHHASHGAAGTRSVEDLAGRHPRFRQRVGVDTPDGRDLGAMSRVGDLTIAGKLVGLLAVFAAALSVSLAGETAVAAERLAGLTERQDEVDESQDVVDALALLFGTAAAQHHGGRGFAHDVGRLDDLPLRHAGDALDAVGPVKGRDAADRLEPRSPLSDEIAVDEVVADGDMQEAGRQRAIGAGRRLQVQGSGLGGGGAARVDHDELAAAGALLVEILHQRRHCLGRVAARQQHGLGTRDVGDREGQAAIDAEGFQPGRRGRGHAEPPIIVDIGRADRDPGEFPEQVGLFVGQAATPEDGDRIGAVLLLDRGEAARHEVERLVPTGGTERVRLSGRGRAASGAVRVSPAGRRPSILYGRDPRDWWGNRGTSRSSDHRGPRVASCRIATHNRGSGCLSFADPISVLPVRHDAGSSADRDPSR